MNLPRCPQCDDKYVTSKARFFFNQEGLSGEPVCLYCLAELTGKRIGSTGMLDTVLPTSNVTTVPYREQTIQDSVRGCRPCAERRRALK